MDTPLLRIYGSTFVTVRNFISNNICIEASRGAVTQSVTENYTGCGFDPHSRK